MSPPPPHLGHPACQRDPDGSGAAAYVIEYGVGRWRGPVPHQLVQQARGRGVDLHRAGGGGAGRRGGRSRELTGAASTERVTATTPVLLLLVLLVYYY